MLIANIAGSTAGAILTGSLALTYLTSSGTLRLMAAMGAAFLVLAAYAETGRRRVSMAAAAVASAALVVAIPDARLLWATLHGSSPGRIAHAEDATGLSIVRAVPPRAVVYVNGIGQSWIPFGGIHSALGALPAFVHPNPRMAVVIGLGSGDTAWAVAGRPELQRITCVEIIRPQLHTLQRWAALTRYPGLVELLDDRRLEHVAGDGRAYVRRSASASMMS